MLRVASSYATAVATLGPVVERSMTVLTLEPAMMPRSPSDTLRTMSGIGRHISTVSASEATSAGDAATVAPRAAAGFTASGLVSNTVS
jgi:hypothetical protein